jgi:hypothetical protein
MLPYHKTFDGTECKLIIETLNQAVYESCKPMASGQLKRISVPLIGGQPQWPAEAKTAPASGASTSSALSAARVKELRELSYALEKKGLPGLSNYPPLKPADAKGEPQSQSVTRSYSIDGRIENLSDLAIATGKQTGDRLEPQPIQSAPLATPQPRSTFAETGFISTVEDLRAATGKGNDQETKTEPRGISNKPTGSVIRTLDDLKQAINS